MDRKSKVLLYIFLFCLAAISAFLYSRFYVARDYLIRNEVECDPMKEACFVRFCEEGEEEECTPETEPTYYKIYTVEAAELPLCDPHTETCPELICIQVPSCVEALCDAETLPEGEECNDPVAYQQVHPLLEEDSLEAAEENGSLEAENPENEQ